MDEPFGALDAQTRTQLQSELLQTWERDMKTCFFITHDVDEAIILAQKVIVMSARPGRVKAIIDIDIPLPARPGDEDEPALPRAQERDMEPGLPGVPRGAQVIRSVKMHSILTT